MAQSIEFCLHPPSPPKCHLPSVNSLLNEEDFEADLPLLLLPSPSLSSTSSLLLEPCSSSTSVSPLMSSLSLDKFLLPPLDTTRRSRSLSNASSSSSIRSLSPGRTRRRGRPPKCHDENWTFVTPTVCRQQEHSVHTEQLQKKETILHWTHNKGNLDTTPKKKRGRKPKIQLAGNFCFVWRDLTAKRGANKKEQKIK